MNFEEKTKKTEYIYNGRILNLRKDTVELPNGKDGVREIIEHGGGSCVLCVKGGKVLLVKQYRYAYKEVLFEIPAGKHDKGETAEMTAIRELNEECGLIAKKAEHIFDIYPTPGYTNEVINIFYVSDFTLGKTGLDEDEFLTSFWVDIKKAKQMIESGEIKDAKTVIALLYLINREKLSNN